MNKQAAPSNFAPLAPERVVLRVRDLDGVGEFYKTALGLVPLSGDGESLRLGAGGRTLVELRRDRHAQSRPREAGLFHTAFLAPDRDSLGRWLRFYAGEGHKLDGASDHLVSEALYLHDPEGNGIEVYVDRPRDQWRRRGGQVEMATLPLDLNGLALAASAPFSGAPDGMVVGHVHLQVGDTKAADDFYVGRLGFDRMTEYPGASFYGAGGYHHHLAGNVWRSAGAGRRTPGGAGLEAVVLSAAPEVAAKLGAGEFADPWGTRLEIEKRAG